MKDTANHDVKVSLIARAVRSVSALVSAAFPRAPETRRQAYNWIASTATVVGCWGILGAAVIWFGSDVHPGDKWREFGGQVLQVLVPGCFFLLFGAVGLAFLRRFMR
jgi:hypothetical protein